MTPDIPSGTQLRSPGENSHLSDTMYSPGLLALVAGLTAAVLVLTVDDQIFDTNFYSLWEATALLAGDHPYRDFFEWGVPLQVVVSAVAQVLVGHRLIGEYLVQWVFIIAGMVISFHLGLYLSRSIVASLATTLLALAFLAVTPPFHYPKLFFYPLAVSLAWWYMDRPGTSRSTVLGVVTALAFLFRHDHGVYMGIAVLVALALVRLAMPASRSLRLLAKEGAAYTAVAVAILAPWLVLVHVNEGFGAYVRSRTDLYREWSPSDSPYRSLVTMNPVRALTPEALPAGAGTATAGEGAPWQLPSGDSSIAWLHQMTLLVPVLLLLAAAVEAGRSWWRAGPVQGSTYRLVLAAVFLLVIDGRVLRQQSYFVVVAPLTAALSARLLTGGTRETKMTQATHPFHRLQWSWSTARGALALGLLLVTGVTSVAYARRAGIFDPFTLARAVPPAFGRLLASPPIDGYVPLNTIRALDPASWHSSDPNDNLRVRMRYVHDCSTPGDRLLVTGSTPYQVGYYAGRPIAGGHLFWHLGWRADAVREAQSLALLQNQSVPFAFSTSDPILEDFKQYPRILDYLLEHYVEPEDADGLLLVDMRRLPTGTFEPTGWPCFR